MFIFTSRRRLTAAALTVIYDYLAVFPDVPGMAMFVGVEDKGHTRTLKLICRLPVQYRRGISSFQSTR